MRYLKYIKLAWRFREYAWILVIIMLFGYAYWRHQNPVAIMSEKEVPVAVEVIPKGYVPLEQCQAAVRDKTKILKVIELPASIEDNPDKQVAEVVECEKHDAKTTVAAVLDTRTGETTMYVRPERPAFFSFDGLNRDKEIGIRYGLTADGTGYDIYGRWTFFRTGAIHYSFYGEASNDRNFKGMVEASWRF